MIVKIYRDKNSVEPYTKWINSFKDFKTKARIQQRIRRIEIGNLGVKKSLGKGVWELKFDFGAGYRIYYGVEGNEIIILLAGGNKKTQEQDILTAQKLWKEYKES